MKALLGAFVAASVLMSVSTAHAKPESSSAAACTLIFGGDQANPGAMIQYLKTRDKGASGNPKEVADAYPGEFDNVGDLIASKCDVGSK